MSESTGWGPTRRGLLAAAAGTSAALVGAPAVAKGVVPLADADTLTRWTHHVAAMGTRLTGTPAQATYVDWLADQWTHAGLQVRTDRHTLTRWAPHRWSLRVAGEPVDVSSPYAYSGLTPAGGVHAPLAYLGAGEISSALWSSAAGKIAVVDIPSPLVSTDAVFPENGHYSADAQLPKPSAELAVSDILLAPDLAAAAKAGVKGVLCLRAGVSDALAADQYTPFTTAYGGCPALWVAPSASAGVRRQALAGATATLTLAGRLHHGTATDTIWAVLPGVSPKEAVVINTHTDGPNIAEENGGLGLLSLVRHFASIPRARRPRSLIFVATTGHFQLPQFAVGGGQSASRWIADHPELVDGRVRKPVAALTLEHLGCREWLDDSSGHYRATGAQEPGYVYTTTGAMRRAYLRSCLGTDNRRTFTCLPGAIYLGEGDDFHAAGIATASLIPGPSYLCAAPVGGGLRYLDHRLMKGQIATFANLVARLGTMTAAQIGTPATTAGRES